MKNLYLTSQALFKQLGLTADTSTKNHNITTEGDLQILSPTTTNSENVNPKTFSCLKNDLNISTITILDRVKSSEKNIMAGEQINRSGFSFLRGKTPFENHPTFPDVSEALVGTPQQRQITVGEKRFKTLTGTDTTDCFEWMAPVATLWHYVGVKTTGVGVDPEETTIQHILS